MKGSRSCAGPSRRLALLGIGALLTHPAAVALAQPAGSAEPMAWPFCRRHNARIEQLHRTAAGEHLRVLGVSLDGDPPAVRRCMDTNDYHFPVVVGESGLRDRSRGGGSFR